MMSGNLDTSQAWERSRAVLVECDGCRAIVCCWTPPCLLSPSHCRPAAVACDVSLRRWCVHETDLSSFQLSPAPNRLGHEKQVSCLPWTAWPSPPYSHFWQKSMGWWCFPCRRDRPIPIAPDASFQQAEGCSPDSRAGGLPSAACCLAHPDSRHGKRQRYTPHADLLPAVQPGATASAVTHVR